MKKVILALLVIVLAISLGYYYISGLPQYTFYLINKAIKNHDIESFYQYVDVDSIIDNFMNDAWKEAMQGQPTDGWGALGAGLAQAMKPVAKTMLTELAKQEITNSIEDIKQPEEPKALAKETPFKSFMNRFKSFKEFSKIKINTKGKIAEVEIPSGKAEEKLTMRMRKTPGRYWKIVAIKFPYQPKEIKPTIQAEEKQGDAKGEDVKQKEPIDLKNNPIYEEYYVGLRNKISKIAYNGYNRAEEGEVYLNFTVRNDGEVKDIRIDDSKSSNSPYLRKIAVEAVRTVGRFPAFPENLKYPELDFNVVLSYEIN